MTRSKYESPLMVKVSAGLPDGALILVGTLTQPHAGESDDDWRKRMIAEGRVIVSPAKARWVPRPRTGMAVSLEEALHIASLRIKHTAGVRFNEVGIPVDVYDPEGELLFGKVTGIAACPNLALQRLPQDELLALLRWRPRTAKLTWHIAGPAVREP